MTYRTRMSLAFLFVALMPVVATGLLVRHETTRWLTAQFDERASAVASSVTDALEAEAERVDEALEAVSVDARVDNDLRLAVLSSDSIAAYLIDYAPRTMRRTPLDVLMLVADDGRLLSSGHFRNDFGRDLAGLTDILKPDILRPGVLQPGGPASLVRIRTPDGQMLALVRVAETELGAESVALVGGTSINTTWLRGLSNDPALTVRLSGLPGDLSDELFAETADATSAGISFRSELPFVDAAGAEIAAGRAWIEVTHDTTPLVDLLADLNRWFLVVLGVAAAGAVLGAIWFADRLSRPLVELADRAARFDMQRSGDLFLMRRNDEIGQLSRRLGEMVKRLRESAGSLRAAERRATLGDMARQVNHDVRNGLTPIKNVVRHLSELSEDDPSGVGPVFLERRRTLESSIAYLEELASRYAKLSPQTRRESCELVSLARQVVDDFRASGLRTVSFIGKAPVLIEGDPVALRRMIENLIHNALESADGAPVDVAVRVSSPPDSYVGRLTVTDNGPGIPPETRDRMFDDFFTTKSTGTGLGLSIVRRVALDHNAKIMVTDGRDAGTTFAIEFPLTT